MRGQHWASPSDIQQPSFASLVVLKGMLSMHAKGKRIADQPRNPAGGGERIESLTPSAAA
jgi:hypothetical protein